MSTDEKLLLEKIESELKIRKISDWVFKDFSMVYNNNLLRILLQRAYMETAQRDYKNRHGILHGLATAYNCIQLFDLIKNDVVESDYQKIFGLSKDEVLLTLMVAGFVHDTGRFYDDAVENHEEHVNDSIAILQRMLQLGAIFTKANVLSSQEIIKRVKELCLSHNQKHKPSGKVEIALIKLADALDVGPHRVYTKEDKPIELAGDEESVLRLIFRKDKYPVRYFGPLSIESVRFNWNNTEKIVELTFAIKDFACAEEIKKILNILDACTRNGRRPDDPVKTVASRIHVYVRTPSLQRCRLHPSDPDLLRSHTEAALIRDARIPNVEYGINLLNMDGDAEIELPLQIVNVNNEDGIETQTAFLGGLKQSEWKNIGMKWFEETASGLKDLPPPQYLGSIEGGKMHNYRIDFGRKLGISEDIALKGRCLWKEFINVMEDEMTHTVATPTERLKIDVLFPKEASSLKVMASAEAKDIDGRIIMRTPIEPEKIDGRLRLTLEIDALVPQHTLEFLCD